MSSLSGRAKGNSLAVGVTIFAVATLVQLGSRISHQTTVFADLADSSVPHGPTLIGGFPDGPDAPIG